MLTNATEILGKAKKAKYAVPQFNVNDATWAKFILEECQENNSPVILGTSEGAAKYMGGYIAAAKALQGLVESLKVTIPVVIHLDHGLSVENCKKAIDAGYTSVMFDGSTLSVVENVKKTREVVEYAKKHNVSVEAEVGTVGGNEDGVVDGIRYAKLDECKKISNTGITMLAASLGSVHGFYYGEPKLGFKEMEIYAKETNLPLVLHGGSGIPDDQIRKAINAGEAKINVNTEIQFAFAKGIRQYIEENKDKTENGHMLKNITNTYAIPYAKKIIKEKIELFGSKNKG